MRVRAFTGFVVVIAGLRLSDGSAGTFKWISKMIDIFLQRRRQFRMTLAQPLQLVARNGRGLMIHASHAISATATQNGATIIRPLTMPRIKSGRLLDSNRMVMSDPGRSVTR